MVYRQPVKMNSNWSDVVPWLCIGDETSSSILHALQWSDGCLGKACKGSVAIAIVESADYECSDQTFSDFLTGQTTDLTQSPQLEEAAANNWTYLNGNQRGTGSLGL